MTDNNIHMSGTNNVKTLKQLRIGGQAVIEQSVIEEEQYEIVDNNNQVQQQQHVFLEPASATIITGTHPEPDYEDLLDDIPLNPTQPVQYDDDDLEDEETLDEEEIQNHPPPNNHHVGQQQGNFIARLRAKENILLVSEHTIEIGRNSSKSNVHFHVSKNNFVSRKHLILQFEPKNKAFYLMCLSKNGVFVDGVFQRKGADPLRLAKISTFRFPSTNIRIEFENLVNQQYDGGHATNNKTSHLDSSAVIYSPLKIAIPDNDKLKSPYPSPTGTISAANSCPTSPRQGYHDFQNYHGHSSSHTFSNEPQAPSTSSNNEYEKPPYSYAQLIVQSISASPEKQLTLSGIYSFISKNYPYYRTGANKGWQNSIRHNLSLNRYFIKVPRSQDEPGKGSFWRIDPLSEMKLIDQSYRKRRQRGSQCFRTPYGMPRSAPVSPTHMDNSFPDNSRENSPLNDVIMQSAPGSPGSNNNYNSNNHREEHSFGSSSYKSHHTSYDSQGGIKRENDLYDEQADYLSDEYETVKRQKTN